jgi:hypothetical protein
VTIYLLGMSALHITTPVLLSLATFNNTFSGYVQITPSRPNILSSSPKCVYVSTLLHGVL